ncbi:MAG: alpha/beta hydrolase [Chloroflexi bacterium]|nr:alpha/beta hydrolase [Chloroflexota bacterium]
MPFASVNGIQLYYETHGSGPAVVLAHGAGGNHLSWWQQVPVLARSYRVITFDHRAFGRSLDGDGEAKLGRRMFHDDLRALLDLLEIERAAIVAQSMGGRTAVGFALRNPGRCRAMVLAGTTGGAIDDDVREMQETYRQTEIGSLPLLKRAVSPELRQRAEHMDFLYRSISRLNPARPRDFLAAIPGYRGSSAGRLAEADFPVLFLVGDSDAITPPEIVERCHRAVPGSEYQIIAGSGHSAYFEQADAFNAAVVDFLERAPP